MGEPVEEILRGKTSDTEAPDRSVDTAQLPSKPYGLSRECLNGDCQPLDPSPTVSEDQSEDTYPEGGLRASLSVLGSLCGMMCCFGLMNTIGTFQAYLSSHQLASYTEANVGWIFGLYLFISYLGGMEIGPIFDARGPRLLIAVGTTCLLACMFLLAVCIKYWHFMLVFGMLGGLGTSLISTPAIASIGHFYSRRRGVATGVASCGGSIGGIVFPLMLQSLFVRVGFAWATRALGFLFMFLLLIANLLIRSRLPPKPMTKDNILPDLKMFKNLNFTVVTTAIFLIEWGLFIPLSYITLFALRSGIETAFAYQLLAILNAGSFFGRWLPGILADHIGRFNTMILMIGLCMVTTFVFWLPSSLISDPHTIRALLIVYAIFFGFSSGSNISLGPVCVGQLCDTSNYGAYFATCYTFVGIGTLVGIPIAGEIMQASNGSYVGLVCFTGACYATGLASFIWARIRAVGWSIRTAY